MQVLNIFADMCHGKQIQIPGFFTAVSIAETSVCLFLLLLCSLHNMLPFRGTAL